MYYTKTPTPPTPVDPTPVNPTPPDPETPTPSNPTPDVPIIPDSDILDSGLLYLAPLGAVAYVPSTGIVNSATADIFEQDFAEIILSQGFVMAVLLIFAGSFSIYFSNRKYMAPATAATTAKKARKATYAKSAKKMPAGKKTNLKSASKTKTAAKKHKK